MKLSRGLSISLISFFWVGNLFAQEFDLQNIVPSQIKSLLLEKGEASCIYSEKDKTIVPKFVPQTEYGNNAKDFVFGKTDMKKIGFAAEKLYCFKKENIKTKVNTDTVSKIMRSISKMQGMQYFSRSRKEWNTLYDKAYRVENPNAKKLVAVADLTSGSADGQEIYAFLNDHTFDESVYKISYKQNQNELLMFMENYSTLSYGFVKAVKPGDLKMCVLIIDCGDCFLVYIANYAEFKIPSMMKSRLNNSFEARLEAIYNWFKNQF